MTEPNSLRPFVSAASEPPVVKRSQQKRWLILQAAMEHFAEHGYEASRVADIAGKLEIAKGSVFQHFGSKDGLFFEVYKVALRSLPSYLDVPEDVKRGGFFAIVRHRLTHCGRMAKQHRVACRILLLGNYGTDLKLRNQIVRFLDTDDPLGKKAFLNLGLEHRQLRGDIDPSLLSSILEFTFERFLDSLLTEDLYPELAHARGERTRTLSQEHRIDEFMKVLRSALGTPPRT